MALISNFLSDLQCGSRPPRPRLWLIGIKCGVCSVRRFLLKLGRFFLGEFYFVPTKGKICHHWTTSRLVIGSSFVGCIAPAGTPLVLNPRMYDVSPMLSYDYLQAKLRHRSGSDGWSDGLQVGKHPRFEKPLFPLHRPISVRSTRFVRSWRERNRLYFCCWERIVITDFFSTLASRARDSKSFTTELVWTLTLPHRMKRRRSCFRVTSQLQQLTFPFLQNVEINKTSDLWLTFSFSGGHTNAPSENYCSGVASGYDGADSNGVQRQPTNQQRLSTSNQHLLTNNVAQQNSGNFYQVKVDRIWTPLEVPRPGSQCYWLRQWLGWVRWFLWPLSFWFHSRELVGEPTRPVPFPSPGASETLRQKYRTAAGTTTHRTTIEQAFFYLQQSYNDPSSQNHPPALCNVVPLCKYWYFVDFFYCLLGSVKS